MRLESDIRVFLASALLLSGSMVACTRMPQPAGEEPEGIVRLSLDTKALSLPAGQRTFRVALFDSNNEYATSGSYSTTTSGVHVDANTGADREWLLPCRVNDSGAPLNESGVVTDNLADADHRSEYGLRWGGGGSISLVAVSPAVRALQDELDDRRCYVEWSADTDDPLYVSAPAAGTFAGSWVSGAYVYQSSTQIPALVDYRASISVFIDFDRDPNNVRPVDEAFIQSVSVTNRIVSDRYYLQEKGNFPIGFTLKAMPDANKHYTISDTPKVLYDWSSDGGVIHLEKAHNDTWTSAAGRKVYLPAVNFADTDLTDAVRPAVLVKLGSDTDHPFTAKVVLNQTLSPMKHYTYKLLVSKTYVNVYLSVADWGSGGTQNVATEMPAYVGSVSIAGGAGGWEDGQGGSAEI